MSYTNAKRILTPAVLKWVQKSFPKGGLMYVPPITAIGDSVRQHVKSLLIEGKEVAEIAKEDGKTKRRVYQIRKE